MMSQWRNLEWLPQSWSDTSLKKPEFAIFETEADVQLMYVATRGCSSSPKLDKHEAVARNHVPYIFIINWQFFHSQCIITIINSLPDTLMMKQCEKPILIRNELFNIALAPCAGRSKNDF
jgi:hypothetical protein